MRCRAPPARVNDHDDDQSVGPTQPPGFFKTLRPSAAPPVKGRERHEYEDECQRLFLPHLHAVLSSRDDRTERLHCGRCRKSLPPGLTLSEVQFSPIRTPKLQRNWTAVLTVDAAECAANSAGHFEIVFTRLSENAPDLEFREHFAWSSFPRNIALDFAADEAVAGYRIENITPCVCRDKAAKDRAAANIVGRKP